MSTPPAENGAPKPVSRAAELAAQQVESIVEAAQASAAQLADTAKKELDSARQEAEQVRVLARESAKAELDSARKEARERIAEAQTAADDVLAEAKAVSSGMRQLAHLLTTHAERILRDVTNSHRAISAELRAAGAEDVARTAPAKADAPSREEEARDAPETPRPRARARSSGDNPFADLEPPSWVES